MSATNGKESLKLRSSAAGGQAPSGAGLSRSKFSKSATFAPPISKQSVSPSGAPLADSS